MDRRDVYLDESALKAAEVIIRAGFAESVSGAIRIAVRQFALTVSPLATPTTP